MTRRGAATQALVLVALLALCPAAAARAERGWVRGAPLNLRSGPGTQFRILAAVGPGEGLDVLERAEHWTKVRTPDGKEGWISAGYMDPIPPPQRRLEQLDAQVETLQAQLESSKAEASGLRDTNQSLSGADEGQRAEIERLTRENYKLRAGQRWAEWIIGASILGMGMVAGAILSRVSARRSHRRLRL